jgi:hypothetical protein
MVGGCVARASPRPRVANRAGTACQEEDVGRCQDEKEGGGVMRFPYSRTGSLCET